VFIKEYFQEIESQISANPYASESRVLKDTRSLHIGIIEGEIMFTNESLLHFIEFVNVKDEPSIYKYSYHYQDKRKRLMAEGLKQIAITGGKGGVGKSTVAVLLANKLRRNGKKVILAG